MKTIGGIRSEYTGMSS